MNKLEEHRLHSKYCVRCGSGLTKHEQISPVMFILIMLSLIFSIIALGGFAGLLGYVQAITQ